MSEKFQAIVVGSGPNGLSAGITLAKAGISVLIIEAEERIGGGLHTAEKTLPGFLHDVCSAIHPLSESPFFRSLDLQSSGVEWIHSPFAVAHPLENGRAGWIERDITATSRQFGVDEEAYRKLLQPFLERWREFQPEVLGPPRLPAHPLLLARFGLRAIRSVRHLAREIFSDDTLAAVFAGNAAHSVLPLDRAGTAAFAILFSLFAHADGWPFPKGGAGELAKALAQIFRSLGGQIRTGQKINSIAELPPHEVVLFDLTPKEFLRIAGAKLSPAYRRQLENYRYGAGVFKIDYALSAPAPFLAEPCRRAATVHIGGSFEEIAESERLVGSGILPEKPFVLFAQHTPFDPSRAPEGKHTAWAYCHVPNGADADMTGRIENQIERFAPGFKDCVLARSTMSCRDFEAMNPNYSGGDINGGSLHLRQIAFRPVVSLSPYRTSAKNMYLCSAATPPGSGIHGMCGMHAARQALRDHYNL